MKFTFLYVTRNDNYCGDAPLRFKTSLLNLVSQLSNFEFLKKHVEILVVDWNSDIPIKDHTYLQNFNKQDIDLKYLIVPPNIAKKYNKKGPVSEVHAYNVGVRFSSGRYILRVDQDILIGPRFLQYLTTHDPNDNELLWCSRRDIPPSEFLPEQVIHLVYDDPVLFIHKFSNKIQLWHTVHCNEPNIYDGNGAVGIFGFSKNIWYKIGGYHEHLTGWGHMEVELKKYFLLHNCYWNNLHDVIDCNFYHLYHTTHTNQEREMNSEIFPPRNQDNTWGLVDDLQNLNLV